LIGEGESFFAWELFGDEKNLPRSIARGDVDLQFTKRSRATHTIHQSLITIHTSATEPAAR
jgi:hypothetical protein